MISPVGQELTVAPSGSLGQILTLLSGHLATVHLLTWPLCLSYLVSHQSSQSRPSASQLAPPAALMMMLIIHYFPGMPSSLPILPNFLKTHLFQEALQVSP